MSLTILDIGRLDEGVYTCTALNSLGSMSVRTKLVVPPSDLNSVTLGNSSALVLLSRPSHDGSFPYLLEHKHGDQVIFMLLKIDLYFCGL